MASKRSRAFTSILYPDSSSYDCDAVLTKIQHHYPEFAFILHDRDTYLRDVYDENDNLIHSADEVKKSHYHVIYRFKNARSLTAIAEDLGIPENDIEIIKNWKSQVRYLIHLDDVEKVQYEPSSIVSSFSVQKYLQNELTESSELKEILDIIDTHKIIYIEDLLVLLVDKPELLPTFRHYSYVLSTVIRDRSRRRSIAIHESGEVAAKYDHDYENSFKVQGDFIPYPRLRTDDPIRVGLDQLEDEV